MYVADEYRDLAETALRFSKDRLLPHYQAREAEERYDRALMREMGELGLIGPELPEEYGGLGLTNVASGIVTEAIAYGDFNVAYVQSSASLLGQVLARSAEKALAAEWIPKIVRGEVILGVGLTEPSAGSDAARVKLKAVRRGDHYVLSGEKTSISSADQADGFVIFARSGTVEEGARGVTAFFVPGDAKGLTRTRFNDLGSKIVGRGSLFFDDVEVPLEHRVGGEGKGFYEVMSGFDFNRAVIGLMCCGAAQASIDETWRYAQQRETFGVKLAQHQGVTFPIAEHEALIAASRQLCYHTLWLRDQNRAHTVEAAMVKWLAPKSAFDAIRQCLLTHGHYGWSLDLPHQQRMRDVMGLEIGDGTAQIMKLIIAREAIKRISA
ncbi:acyl-CoA dehydrogenase family protein [Enterovirga aerilata]|uniref:Cyclohexanecarboxyl-CoA dehydrogenase n=1 Tax=Enterovirga aerilata TaxID=2730920 RepID=A0A849I9Q2_9HYPH|nr:acyl-CoA dehydrogenase family protein [Enterovirga sp. DB1703]NNM74118.1 cyclohexanecarboxyl-CoA dehydrogenase [Enterovirga sp. DB1703]